MKPGAAAASNSTYCSSLSSTASSFGASIDTASSNTSGCTSTEHVEEEASQFFIMKVQHLIERCLTFYLDEEECVKALFEHAGIDPVVTRTVWKGLEKENRDFFEQYKSSTAEREARKKSDIFSSTDEDDEGPAASST